VWESEVRERNDEEIILFIIRFKNYMVAMVNKHLLPLQFQVPILGETVFLTHGLKYNLEMLLFCKSSRILMFLRKAVLLVLNLFFDLVCRGTMGSIRKQLAP
jgi:hypothetical protein